MVWGAAPPFGTTCSLPVIVPSLLLELSVDGEGIDTHGQRAATRLLATFHAESEYYEVKRRGFVLPCLSP